ncbi:MAG: glycosyltransferase family 4 protein [Roseiflexaceae bacterium]
MNNTITIVSTWYGPDTAGGAETAARKLAIALHQAGYDVEVWATNARDLFAPHTAHYDVGEQIDEGIVVRRFAISPPLEKGDIPRYIKQHSGVRTILKQIQPGDLEVLILSTLAYSNDMLQAIALEQARRRFIFVPYPLPSSVWGVMLAPTHSYLLPCMHDEPYAYHRITQWQITHAKGLLANSAAERDFLMQQYHLPAEQVALTRLGIDLGVTGNGARFKSQFNITTPMLFFAGRKDSTKNVPLLIRYVQEYIMRRGRLITLVLSGRDELMLTSYQRAFVRDVGFLSEQEKADAFAAADIFVHAGTQESFAFVLMEAWLQGRPALVNRDCAVTASAVAEADGGMDFNDFATFAAALDIMLNNPALTTLMGQNGKRYVLENCRWPDVAQRVATAVLNG